MTKKSRGASPRGEKKSVRQSLVRRRTVQKCMAFGAAPTSRSSTPVLESLHLTAAGAVISLGIVGLFAWHAHNHAAPVGASSPGGPEAPAVVSGQLEPDGPLALGPIFENDPPCRPGGPCPGGGPDCALPPGHELLAIWGHIPEGNEFPFEGDATMHLASLGRPRLLPLTREEYETLDRALFLLGLVEPEMARQVRAIHDEQIMFLRSIHGGNEDILGAFDKGTLALRFEGRPPVEVSANAFHEVWHIHNIVYRGRDFDFERSDCGHVDVYHAQIEFLDRLSIALQELQEQLGEPISDYVPCGYWELIRDKQREVYEKADPSCGRRPGPGPSAEPQHGAEPEGGCL